MPRRKSPPSSARRLVSAGFALALLARTAVAQEVTTAPNSRPVSSPRPSSPVTVRPDVVVHQGTLSAGTTGKLLVSHEARLARGVHSSLQGFMALANPSDAYRDSDLWFRRGSMLWMLHTAGTHGEVGLAGDPNSKTLHCTLSAPLPAAISLQAFGQSRWTRTPQGGELVEHASVSLRRPLAAGIVVQPGFYVFDGSAQNDARWFGKNLRIELRGAELFLNDEGDRGRRASARKVWRHGTRRLTLGGEIAQHDTQPDRALLELGVAAGGLGMDFYPGHARRALLLHAGALHFGVGQRDRAKQVVVGYENMTLSLTWHPNGTTDVGVGFVWRGIACGATRAITGWQVQTPLPKAALEDPRLRWPGLAAL